MTDILKVVDLAELDEDGLNLLLEHFNSILEDIVEDEGGTATYNLSTDLGEIEVEIALRLPNSETEPHAVYVAIAGNFIIGSGKNLVLHVDVFDDKNMPLSYNGNIFKSASGKNGRYIYNAVYLHMQAGAAKLIPSFDWFH